MKEFVARKIRLKEAYTVTLKPDAEELIFDTRDKAQGLADALCQTVEDFASGRYWNKGKPSGNGVYLIEMDNKFTIINVSGEYTDEINGKIIGKINRHMLLNEIKG